MSLATTCTNCSTCFRVVQDQLRVSEGWVRCGHCQQVFNALESLFDLDAPHQPVALPPAAPGPGRGVWQTEATARWMRQRSVGHDAPAEREEPLSDDVLAALQAEAAPALPAVDDAPALPPDDEDDEAEAVPAAPLPAFGDLFESAPVHAAPAPLFAPAPWLPPAAAPIPAPATATAPAVVVEAPLPPPETAEPAPLDDGIGETAFAPFSVTEERREPVFEATRYEPHGFEEDAPAAPAYLHTALAPDDTAAPAPPPAPVAEAPLEVALPPEQDEDHGPTSAAMLLTESTEVGPPALPPAADEAKAADETQAVPLPSPEDQPVDPGTPADPAPDPGAEPLLPSFLAAAEQRERYRPAARWAFGAVAALLTAALVAQVAWHWRERLAMAWPITQGPLAALCDLAGCELGAPRELNAVVVDNTALARPPGSAGYRLTVQLHNKATHPVAVPSIDLVLTDGQGAVVARRVLAPADFDYQDAALAAQAELQWTAEFTLGEGSLVGYTVAAFYP